eukprot:Rmarinus@m.12906
MEMYLDGALLNAGNSMTEPIPFIGNAAIGRRVPNGDLPHYGLLDDFRIYDHALLAADIAVIVADTTDGCVSHSCDDNAVCHDTSASYVCLCNAGYYGSGGFCWECPAHATSEAGAQSILECVCNWDGYVLSDCIDRPVLYLSFDEGSGTSITDSSVNGLAATAYLDDWVYGYSSTALNFDGTQYVDVPGVGVVFSEMVINDELSICMWVNGDA